MIRVIEQDEPPSFNLLVRAPGRTFLLRHPTPTASQWRSNSYWRKVLRELHNAYGGICAYSCHWIPWDVGSTTVEHFRPKKLYPNDAFEWANYRLVCGTLNGRKGDDILVLDPFTIADGWFVLKFPQLLVAPAPELPQEVRDSVLYTIARLRLNDEGTCVRSRFHWVHDYCLGRFTFPYLKSKAPFIAREIERQNLQTTIRTVMSVS